MGALREMSHFESGGDFRPENSLNSEKAHAENGKIGNLIRFFSLVRANPLKFSGSENR